MPSENILHDDFERKRKHHALRFDALARHMALDPAGPELEGWGIYSGCEGEDPRFVGFVVHEELARFLVDEKNRDADDEPLVFDGCAMSALLTARGVITSNDYTIKTHADVRAKLAESWWDDDRLVTGCIGLDLDCGCPKCKPEAAP